jgi:hypothetical protein
MELIENLQGRVASAGADGEVQSPFDLKFPAKPRISAAARARIAAGTRAKLAFANRLAGPQYKRPPAMTLPKARQAAKAKAG